MMKSGSGTIIFLVIFFVIILVLVIIAVIGSRKDRTEKLIKNHKERTLNDKAEKERIAIFKKLHKIILDVEKEIEEFKPSIGTKSLGEINREYGQKIQEIKDSEELKAVYAREDYKAEMKEMIDEIAKQKPSNWKLHPDTQFSINLIKVKNEALFNKIEMEIEEELKEEKTNKQTKKDEKKPT